MGDDHGDLFLIQHEGGNTISASDLCSDPLILELRIERINDTSYDFIEVIQSLLHERHSGKLLQTFQNTCDPAYLVIARIDGFSDIVVQGFPGHIEHLQPQRHDVKRIPDLMRSA